MVAAEKARLEDPAGYLSRADQRTGEHRLRGGRAGRLHDAWQMRGHRAGDGPRGGECERQYDHGAIDRDMRLDG